MLEIRDFIREIPDFPKPGIRFQDITPLIGDGDAFRATLDQMAALVSGLKIDRIASPEARGFLFGPPLAAHFGAGFVPIRKPKKLPADCTAVTYDLEYGTDTIEMHTDGVKPGDQVLLVDDVLATGGTMAACRDLVTQLGGEVVGCLFLMELTFLAGREKLGGTPIFSVLEEGA